MAARSSDLAVLACIEVGGSSAQTVLFFDGAAPRFLDGAVVDGAAVAALAVPGIVSKGRVVAASNLDWWDVDPAEQLGLARPFDLVVNDGEAAALGEAALRDVADLVFVGLGTGVGGAVVEDGRVVAGNLFGHAKGFSDDPCACGGTGCLETVAAGWALPDPIPHDRLASLGAAIADAITREAQATPSRVVVAGGMARRHPPLVDAVAEALPDRIVEPSAAPQPAKSAAAWGLRRVVLETGALRP